MHHGDLLLPSVIRGVKLQCPGYRDQLDLAFRDESAEVARKVAAKADPGPVASSRTAESSSTSKRRTDPNGLLALLRQHDEASAIFAAQRVPSLSTLDDQATAFFYAHYLIPGADLGGPTRAPSELDETVLASIRAVGLAGLSRPALAPGGLHVETAKRYVNAIRRTNVALRDAEQVKKDSTLLATMMLGVFETMTGHTPSSLTAWISHIDGAAALVKLRGSEQLRTWNGRRLFLQATTYLMNNCLQRSLPLPKEIMDLTAELGTYMDGTDRIWRLHLASCDVVNFRADVRQDLQPGRTERLTRALELDRRLMHIFSELPLGWDYQIIQTEEDRDLVLTGYYHIYPNFFLVQVWNGARLMRMMLNEIICDDLVAGFAATPALFQVDEYLAHLTRSKETLSQLQAGVIAKRDIEQRQNQEASFTNSWVIPRDPRGGGERGLLGALVCQARAPPWLLIGPRGKRRRGVYASLEDINDPQKTDVGADVFTQFLGILVVVALTRLFRIGFRIRDLAATYRARQALENPPEESLDGPPPESPSTPSFQDSFETVKTGPDSHGSENLLESLSLIERRFGFRLFTSGPSLLGGTAPMETPTGWQISKSVLATLVYFGAYIVVILLGVFTARVKTNNTALSSDPKCGVYYNPLPTAALYYHQAELESAHLAQDCYGEEEGADGCNLFVSQSIDYQTYNASCPFAPDLCLEDAGPAVQYSTGPVSGAKLGINAPQVLEFERNTTCSPLNMNESYVTLVRNGNTKTYQYNYGTVPLYHNHTWDSVPQRDGQGVGSGYQVVPYLSVPGIWAPIAELQAPYGSLTTIIFVDSQTILYSAPSSDPIFPADTRVDSENRTYWSKTSRHATVMACVDSTRWRDPITTDSWSNGYQAIPMSKDAQIRGGQQLFRESLVHSNIYWSLSQRGAAALQAQTKAGRIVSLPMGEEQWKDEAKALYETSLARIQIEARDIAHGTQARFAGWAKEEENEYLGPEICHQTFLFKADGWNNVNWAAAMSILVIGLFIIFPLSFPISTDSQRLLPELVFGTREEWLAYLVVESVRWVGRRIRDLFLLGWTALLGVWRALYRVFSEGSGRVKARWRKSTLGERTRQKVKELWARLTGKPHPDDPTE
ncbi:MAG: hypothetical protein M1838_001872 [Thelocarpon superellum]|nr:MAG: hypothetical protein M1838_001872 [Thelocarpon superellum]